MKMNRHIFKDIKMIEKLLKRAGIIAMFVLIAYLIDGYIKYNNIFNLGVAMFASVDMSIMMFKHYDKY